MGAENEDRGISVADRMFVVLERCATSNRPLSLADLVQRTGYPKSTLHRVCWKLVELGALESTDRGFAIGTKLFALGSMSPELRRLRAMSMPYMHQLVVESGWVANLAVLSDERALIAEEVYGATPTLPKVMGATLPLHASAVGKALLACQPEERRRALIEDMCLRPFTGKTIVREDRLLAQLEEIACTGIAISREEWRYGTSAVASPVLADGEPIAALALIGPHHEDSLLRNGQAVRRAAAHLGRTLARSRPLAVA
jgi:DNA-binding IclR family transcriptional regulator